MPSLLPSLPSETGKKREHWARSKSGGLHSTRRFWLALWTWASYLTSLALRILICKMKMSRGHEFMFRDAQRVMQWMKLTKAYFFIEKPYTCIYKIHNLHEHQERLNKFAAIIIIYFSLSLSLFIPPEFSTIKKVRKATSLNNPHHFRSQRN